MNLQEGLPLRSSTQRSQTGVPRKLIWAIDPYDSEHHPHIESLEGIREYVGGSLSETTPVFISGPQDLGIFSVNEKIQEYLQRYSVDHFKDPRILKTESTHKKKWVELLLKEAIELQAEALILSSHGKKGISKFLVGSFAEALLEASPFPLFFLSSEPQGRSGPVLFATDFSQDAKAAFFEFLKLVDGSQKEIILFHSISFPATSIGLPQFTGELESSFPSFAWQEQNKWAEAEAMRWVSEARSSGASVRFRPVIEEALSGPGDAVLHFAERENVSLIALVSHGRTRGQLFFGSVTRDVLDSKKFNIWACGPRFGSVPGGQREKI